MNTIDKRKQIEIRFSASGLANKDVLSLSDPFLLVHSLQNGHMKHYVGRTETIIDNLNPYWVTSLIVNVSSNTSFIVHVFDEDSKDVEKLRKHDFLGMATFSTNDLLSKDNVAVDLKLRPAQQHLYNDLKKVNCKDETKDSSIRTSASFSSLDANGRTMDKWKNELSEVEYKMERNYEQVKKKYGHLNLVTDDLRDCGFSELTAKNASELKRATCTHRARHNISGTLHLSGEIHQSEYFEIAAIKLHVLSALIKHRSNTSHSFMPITQFYELQRKHICGKWDVLYRSEDGQYKNDGHRVIFKRAVISMKTLSNGNIDSELRIMFFRRRIQTEHDVISWVEISPKLLIELDNGKEQSKPLQSVFHEYDNTGIGTCNISRMCEKKDKKDKNPKIILHADHFIGQRYKAVLRKWESPVMFSEQKYMVEAGQNGGQNGCYMSIEGNKNGKKLLRIPQFITRH